MAEELGLVFELRQALGLTSIGSIDVDRAARAKRRAEIKKERESERRRNDGSMSREEYLARSKSRTKPWEEMGISRRTYERRKARETQSVASAGISCWIRLAEPSKNRPKAAGPPSARTLVGIAKQAPPN
jgi:hypothetical protein